MFLKEIWGQNVRQFSIMWKVFWGEDNLAILTESKCWYTHWKKIDLGSWLKFQGDLWRQTRGLFDNLCNILIFLTAKSESFATLKCWYLQHVLVFFEGLELVTRSFQRRRRSYLHNMWYFLDFEGKWCNFWKNNNVGSLQRIVLRRWLQLICLKMHKINILVKPTVWLKLSTYF